MCSHYKSCVLHECGVCINVCVKSSQIDKAFPIFLHVLKNMGRLGGIGWRNLRAPLCTHNQNPRFPLSCLQSWLPTSGFSCKLVHCPTVKPRILGMYVHVHVSLYVGCTGSMMPLHWYSIRTKPNLGSTLLSDASTESVYVQTTPIIFINGCLLPNKMWVWLSYFLLKFCNIQDVLQK